MKSVLRLAIQKSGRLFESSLKLLEDCGIELEKGKATLKAPAINFPLEVYFLRDDDIPSYVADNLVDAGIIGLNTVAESGAQVEVVERLGFARCRLSIAVTSGQQYQSAESLNGLKIATSYPKLLQEFLDKNSVKATVHEVSGSVEITPAVGLADVICDLVSTGSTLASNGLKEVETIFRSEAILASNSKITSSNLEILEKLRFRCRAVLAARHTKYIMLNVPNEAIAKVTALLPGAKSPSIVPLAEPGWSSLHSVVNEDEFWEVTESLKAAGAQGILVVPIEKMII